MSSIIFRFRQQKTPFYRPAFPGEPQSPRQGGGRTATPPVRQFPPANHSGLCAHDIKNGRNGFPFLLSARTHAAMSRMRDKTGRHCRCFRAQSYRTTHPAPVFRDTKKALPVRPGIFRTRKSPRFSTQAFLLIADQSYRFARSTCTPAPMVELIEIFFR